GFHKDPQKADKWAADNGCRAFYSLEEMLADPEIDAVSITTPSGYHLDPALAAIRAGKHVLIEKPMEITEERINLLIEEAEKHHVLLCGIFQSRFQDASLLMKKAVEENRFGTITLADAQFKWFRTQEYYDSGAWRGTWAIDGGGVLMNQGIHAIDLLLFLMGDPVEVSGYTATLAHERIEVEDVAVATLRFKNGALGIIEGTTGAWPGSLKRIEICGSKGQAVLEEDSITKWEFAEERPEDAEIRAMFAASTSFGGANDPKSISQIGHTREFADFSKAIKNGTKPFVPGEEALRSVHLIRTIYKSAEARRTILF
ncbi:MAG: Gfo/Idh/MocA family oxidoreductase, partial [Oscillospiraceae bacterium]|nr:Gfo/Idh/MocA family oxidoreductase [Oscillospiraceae bacterium]